MTQSKMSKYIHGKLPRGGGMTFREMYGPEKLPKKKLIGSLDTTICGVQRKRALDFTMAPEPSTWAEVVTCPECKKSEPYRQQIAKEFVDRAHGKKKLRILPFNPRTHSTGPG